MYSKLVINFKLFVVLFFTSLQSYRDLKEVTPEALQMVKRNFEWVAERVEVCFLWTTCLDFNNCTPSVLLTVFLSFAPLNSFP